MFIEREINGNYIRQYNINIDNIRIVHAPRLYSSVVKKYFFKNPFKTQQ